METFARRLRSPLDPVVNIYGPDGKRITGNDDTRGLAVLAEMAGMTEKAGTYWQAYRSKLDPEKQKAENADAMRRIALLPLEQQANERLATIRQTMLEIAEQLANTDLDSEDGRAGAVDQERPLLDKIGQATEHLDALRGKDLAGTITVTAMRSAPHPEVVYAGTDIPKAFVDKQTGKDKDKPAPDKPKPN